MDIGSLTGELTLEDKLSSALDIAADKVKKFAEGFDGMVGEVAIGAGVFVGVVAAAMTSVIALGEQGSKIEGVTNAFDTLATKAGTTGDALRGALSEAVRGTVTEMSLMESTQRLLGSGMKLTTDQATLMGEAARALGKATGTDASQGLDIMSSALTTGRVRGLQQQIGLIDLAAGEEKFAKSIGTTVDQLNEAGKLEGKRIAILDATKAYLDRVGDSQLTFAERIKQGTVAGEEWEEKLAKAVSTSTDVNQALKTVGDAIAKAFGAGNQTLMDAIVSGINAFARGVTAAVPYVVAFAEGVSSVFRALYDNRDILAGLAITVAAYYGAIGLANLAVAAASGLTIAYTATMSLLSGETLTTSAAFQTASLSVGTFALAIGGLVGGYALGKWLEENVGWVRKLSDGVEFVSLIFQGLSSTDAKRAIDQDKVTESTKKATEADDEFLKGITSTVNGLPILTDKQRDASAEYLKIEDTAKKAAEATKRYNDAVAGLVDTLLGETTKEYETKDAIQAIIDSGNTNQEVIQRTVDLIDKQIAAHIPLLEGQKEWAEANRTLKGTIDALHGSLSELSTPIADNTAHLEDSKKAFDEARDSADILPTVLLENSNALTSVSDVATNFAIPAITVLATGAVPLATRAIHAATTETNTYASTLTILGQELRKLGTAGPFGDVIKSVAGTVVQLQEADKWSQQLGENGQKLGGQFGPISTLFNDNASSTQKMAAGVQTAAAIYQGANAVWDATASHATAAGNALGGMAAGAQAGASFGPWGMAIGAAAGMVVGIIRGKPDWAKAADEIANDFGVKISDGLAKSIATNAKTMFGGSMQASAINSLADIIKEAGGLTDKNLSQMTSRLHDVFSMIETHQMTVAQGAAVIDANWDAFAQTGTNSLGLLDKSLTDIIALDEKFGTQSASITQYISGQTSNASKGLSAALTVGTDALHSMDKASLNLEELQNKLANAGTDTEKAKITLDIKDATKTLDSLTNAWQATKVQSQDAASAIASSISGVVSANMKAGMSFIDAVRAAEPSVDALQEQLSATGFKGGAAFDFIKGEVALATDKVAGPALTAIEGYTAGLVGLSNAGVLNQTTFSGLAGQVSATGAALIAQGQDGGQVMLAMKGDLQTIWELQQRYGYSVDDSTQAMIDQGVESGLIGEQGKTDNQKILDVLMAIGEALGATIPAGLKNMQDAGSTTADTLKKDMDAAKKALVDDPSSLSAAAQAAAQKLQDDLTKASAAALTDPKQKSLVAAAIEAGNELELQLKTAAHDAVFGAGGVNDSISKVTSSVDVAVHGHWDISAPPTSTDPSPVQMASGGSGRVTGPTLFYSAGNEDFAFSGESKSFRGSPSTGTGGDVIVPVYLDGHEITRVVVPLIPDELRRQGVIN